MQDRAARSVLKVSEGDLEDPGDTQQRGQLDVPAGFHVLDGAAIEAGGLPHLVLGEALAAALGAHPFTDGP